MKLKCILHNSCIYISPIADLFKIKALSIFYLEIVFENEVDVIEAIIRNVTRVSRSNDASNEYPGMQLDISSMIIGKALPIKIF